MIKAYVTTIISLFAEMTLLEIRLVTMTGLELSQYQELEEEATRA